MNETRLRLRQRSLLIPFSATHHWQRHSGQVSSGSPLALPDAYQQFYFRCSIDFDAKNKRHKKAKKVVFSDSKPDAAGEAWEVIRWDAAVCAWQKMEREMGVV